MKNDLKCLTHSGHCQWFEIVFIDFQVRIPDQTSIQIPTVFKRFDKNFPMCTVRCLLTLPFCFHWFKKAMSPIFWGSYSNIWLNCAWLMASLFTMTTPSLTSGLDELSQFFVISLSGVLGAPVKKHFYRGAV